MARWLTKEEAAKVTADPEVIGFLTGQDGWEPGKWADYMRIRARRCRRFGNEQRALMMEKVAEAIEATDLTPPAEPT